MKKTFLLAGALLVLFACKQDINSVLSTEECSSIKEVEGKKVLSNYYFERIDSQRVFAVNELVYLQGTALPFYKFSSVQPANGGFNFSFYADNFEVKKNLLKTESFSLPGEPAYQLINTDNGQTILNYTYDLYEASFLDESVVRYVGFYANTACNKKESGLKFDKNTAGILSLSSRENKLYSLKINCKDAALLETLDVGSPSLSLRSFSENILDLNSGKTIYFTSDAIEENFTFDIEMSFYTKDANQIYNLLFTMQDDKIELTGDGAANLFEAIIVVE